MRYSSLLSLLSVIPSISAAVGSALLAAPLPQFKAVFEGYFDIAAGYRTNGPFGVRVHNAMAGGSLWDPVTGEVLADILPFSDDGVSSAAGRFFPNAVMPLVWKDGHFAYISTVGSRGGNDHQSWEYGQAETDSPAYSWMNGRFFILRVNGSAIPHLTFTMYEVTN